MIHQENLINACRQGNIEDVQNCLRSNEIAINQSGTNGMAPLHYACEYGHINIVKLLLKHHEININLLDNDGLSPLQIAASRRHGEIVKMLLQQNNIDINKSITHSCPFRITLLDFICLYNHIDILELLLQHKININQKRISGKTPLYIACEQGNENIVELLLQQENIEVNPIDKNGKTPLHIACSKGHESIVKLLLQHNNWRIREITLLTLTSWSAVSKNYKKSIFDHIKNYFLSFEEF